MVSGIYRIINTINGKVYVGQSKDVLFRLNYHKISLRGGYHNNKHLQNSFDKYGESCFNFELLLNVTDENMLDWFEQYYIHLFDSYRNGYNQTKGGAFYGGRGHPLNNPVVKEKMINVRCTRYNSTGFYRVSTTRRKDNQTGLMYIYKYRKDGRVKLIGDKSVLGLKKKVTKKGLTWKILDVKKARNTLEKNKTDVLSNPTKLKSVTNLYCVSKSKNKNYKRGYNFVYKYKTSDGGVKKYVNATLNGLRDIVMSHGLMWGITDGLYEFNHANGIQGVLYLNH